MRPLRLERRWRTAQSNRAQAYVAHFRKKYHRLLLGNRNGFTLIGKELEFEEEAKKYRLDIVGVTSTKRRGSGIVDLDGRWKFFYSGADPSMSAQVSVGILTNRQKSDCVLDWILLGSWACLSKLKVKDRSLICLLQVYAPNVVSEYQAFVDEVHDALQIVGSIESTLLLRDLNEHIRTDSETWKGVIGRHRDAASHENGRYLLQLCCNNCIMNPFFQHRGVYKYARYTLVWRRSLL